MFTCCNKQALGLGFFVLSAWFSVGLGFAFTCRLWFSLGLTRRRPIPFGKLWCLII